MFILGLLNLHVRRGSEPALNQLPHTLLPNGENCKRWSAAILASSENFKQLNSEVIIVALLYILSFLLLHIWFKWREGGKKKETKFNPLISKWNIMLLLINIGTSHLCINFFRCQQHHIRNIINLLSFIWH